MPAPQILAAPAGPAPAAPSAGSTGTRSSRRLLAPEDAARPLTLWGSSSMRSEGGDAGTPLTVRIHEHLALAAAPAAVHAHGVGATRSPHTVLMRGLDTPAVRRTGTSDAATGAIELELEGGLAPAGPLRMPGSVGRVTGLLDGSSGRWVFTPEDPAAAIADGEAFRSALADLAEGSRQVLWMGKNNIRQVERVLEDTQRMVDAADDPSQDSLVLGQWPTVFDPIGSATAEAVEEVNREQERRYGDHFLDLAALLTSEEGLSCPPLAPLRLLEQASARGALEQRIVSSELCAPDGVHLNGWGNLAVSWALVGRMRELRWL